MALRESSGVPARSVSPQALLAAADALGGLVPEEPALEGEELAKEARAAALRSVLRVGGRAYGVYGLNVFEGV